MRRRASEVGRRVGRWLRRNFAHVVAGLLLAAVTTAIASLYVPTITSDFDRVDFSVRTDCAVTPSAITINLVDPPDAYVMIAFEGFERPECTRIELRDKMHVLKLGERGFLDRVTYTDQAIDTVGMHRFEHSPVPRRGNETAAGSAPSARKRGCAAVRHA